MSGIPLTRTYIRAVSVGTNTILFEIPEWKQNVWFELSRWAVPPEQRGYLHDGFQCKVSVYINAQKADDLRICDWGLT